jgi:cell division protein ZapA (FtsZ GTPase activity inhibitor)
LSQKRTVPVTIQGREYRVRAEGDPHSIQRAAELLDETMTKVRARSGTADSVDVALLAALNLAKALATGRGAAGLGEGLEQRIADLARLVETATAADSGSAAS